MIDCVDIPPFLRIVLWVAMASMQFHIAQTDLFFEHYFLTKEVSGNNLEPLRNCSGSERYVNLVPGIGYPHFDAIL